MNEFWQTRFDQLTPEQREAPWRIVFRSGKHMAGFTSAAEAFETISVMLEGHNNVQSFEYQSAAGDWVVL